MDYEACRRFNQITRSTNIKPADLGPDYLELLDFCKYIVRRIFGYSISYPSSTLIHARKKKANNASNDSGISRQTRQRIRFQAAQTLHFHSYCCRPTNSSRSQSPKQEHLRQARIQAGFWHIELRNLPDGALRRHVHMHGMEEITRRPRITQRF